MAAISGETVSAIKVTIVIPMKWPIKGINPQTKTTRAKADLYGRSRTNPRKKMKILAKNEIVIWPPTKAPTLKIIASVIFATRSRRLAGTRR